MRQEVYLKDHCYPPHLIITWIPSALFPQEEGLEPFKGASEEAEEAGSGWDSYTYNPAMFTEEEKDKPEERGKESESESPREGAPTTKEEQLVVTADEKNTD
ncbi:hypothetical protein NDU88_005991 [Pleurodeles waltl]|uniref:Uncharacterized protein n=1 Tax=Pleurodeles waltl TaxID=8319 RepID=A0AAV7TVI0_PLEWA|nr:hypothetical protein NDU88_005991 [Pleurodeles waltl]